MRISMKRLFLFIIFACGISSAIAQATKEVFSTAVDHINCETIRFIHREAGRAEVANNMDCLSFESIYKSIPGDEAGTTGALCKNINDYKNKFKEDKALDAQLNAVVAFANAKIGEKKRKGNVADFKASLEKIKKDALDAAKGTSAASNNATATKPAEETKPAEKTAANVNSDTAKAISEPVATENTAKTGHKTDWLGLLSLLIGLGALGLAYMAYSKTKKLDGGSMHPMSTTYGNKSNKDDSMAEIQKVEKYFKGEIATLNRLIEELMKTVPTVNNPTPRSSPEPVKEEAPIGFKESALEPEPKAEEERAIETERRAEEKREEQEEPEMELVSKPEDLVNPSEPELIERPEENIIERQPEIEVESEKLTAAEPTNIEVDNEEKTPLTGTLFESTPPPTPSADLFAAATPKQPEREYNPVTDTVAASEYIPEPVTSSPEPFMPEKEYEDGEAVPFYKFAGLPNEEGYFENNAFTDEPGKDSIYEIEMYEDVPDKAFFSIRSNPEVIRKAILDPQVYLAPCCTFTDDHEGKHTIILVEEGMLRKENNRWVVYEKAKINFE